MPVIRQLPPSVINKIAAGEVIERPASVVKELLENAVDAGATRVDVTVKGGGSELVRVADNGCGMSADQLLLAVASHATSKIEDADDLFRVQTLGFRGEALASIAEVSHLVLRSRSAEADAGAELEVVGGRHGEVAPCGCAPGTAIEVRNLFFNTPVRRKFLRTTQTEMGHASEAFTRIALAHPRVHFTLRNNERLVYDLPPVDSWRERIVTFFGNEIGESLYWVDNRNGDVALCGYVADPTINRGNNRLQYVFLNGRHIRDRALGHALQEAYRGLLLTGRYPVAFLRLELPPEAVDVNVHPTKLEVRFQDGGRLYSQLLGTLRQKFLSTDLTAKVRSAAPTDRDPSSAHDDQQAAAHRRQLVEWAKSQIPSPARQHDLKLNDAARRPRYDEPGPGTSVALPGHSPQLDPWPGHAPAGPSGAVSPGSPREAVDQERLEQERLEQERVEQERVEGERVEGEVRWRTDERPAAARPGGLQLHNRYLVAESDEGMLVIDQHALHERILYEQLRGKVLAGTLETQRLLVPETVTLTASEAAAALEARDLLAQLGLPIEPFGGDTVLITGYPAMLSGLRPADILRETVEQLTGAGQAPDRRDLLDGLLHMMSCKAAVKAGDRLAPEEISALLAQRHLCQDAHHCPHGRPTALVFTREELDKRFKRI